MLFPKIHRNSKLPPMWASPPWRNIDVRSVNHTDFSGKVTWLLGVPTQHVLLWSRVEVASIWSTVRGDPRTTSHGMAAFSRVKPIDSSTGRSVKRGCQVKNGHRQTPMMRTVTIG